MNAILTPTLPATPLPITKGIVLQITPAYYETAQTLGNLRTMQHDSNRKPSQDLGQAKNTQVDIIGLLGELLVLYALASAKLQPSEFDLFSHPTPIGPDFRLNRRTYNVKTVPWTAKRQYAYINEEQRTTPAKHADFYLIVALDERNTARVLAPVSCDTVAAWPLYNGGHSPCRSFPVDKLPLLTSWNQLTR